MQKNKPLEKVATSVDGKSVLYRPYHAKKADSTYHLSFHSTVQNRPSGGLLPDKIIVPGPSTVPLDTMCGAPGPPADIPSPLRVLVSPFAAREEGIEAWCDYLASGIGKTDVNWAFAIWKHSGPEISGKMLKQWGPVWFLPDDEQAAWAEFRRIVYTFSPHIIHAHHKLAAQWGQMCLIPVVVTIHGIRHPHTSEFYGGEFADISIRTSNVCCDADYTIFSGIRPVPHPERRNVGVIAWGARLDAGSNIELFLDALALVPEAQAVIMGRASLRDFDCQAEIDARGIGDRVKYLGHLPAQEARTILASSDAVVSLCQHSFGFALIEGMSGGALPIVVDGPGFQAQVGKEWGYVSPTETAEGIAQAIKSFYEDKERDRKRSNMIEQVKSRFSLTRFCNEYLRVYKSVKYDKMSAIVCCNGPITKTRLTIGNIISSLSGPVDIFIIDTKGGRLLEAVSQFSGNNILYISDCNNLANAISRINTTDTIAFIDDSTIPLSNIWYLIREYRRSGFPVVLPKWRDNRPSDSVEPGIYNNNTLIDCLSKGIPAPSNIVRRCPIEWSYV